MSSSFGMLYERSERRNDDEDDDGSFMASFQKLKFQNDERYDVLDDGMLVVDSFPTGS
jgi:hypothetical protein